ncbi:S-layer homology domain-containing protein [Paenibacillus sp. TRM 82003]|nr:S-layer homology domain-containing protein [Paenibacillus sp. TRM 82003]
MTSRAGGGKAWTAGALAVSMIFGGTSFIPGMPGVPAASAAVAGAELTKQQALDRLYRLLPAVSQAVEEEIEYDDGRSDWGNGRPTWSAYWSLVDGGWAMADVDASTGELLLYSYASAMSEEQVYAFHALSREEALEAAEAFLKEAIPSFEGERATLLEDDYGQVVPSLFGPISYSFWLEGTEGGLPAPFKSYRIDVSGSGEVTGFVNDTAAPKTVPAPTPSISKAEATNLVLERMHLDLTYIDMSQYGEEPDWMLAWVPTSSSGTIDAKTGASLGYDGAPIEDAAQAYASVPKAVPGKSFQPYRPASGQITAAQAKAAVARVADVPEHYELVYETLNDESYYGVTTWSLLWEAAEERSVTESPIVPKELESGDAYDDYTDYDYSYPPSVSAVVHAETGQILELRVDEGSEGTTVAAAASASAALSEQEAIRLANAFVNRLSPSASTSLRRLAGAEFYNEADGSTSVQYRPFVNGYPVDSLVSIELTAEGKLRSYYAASVDLPNASAEPITPLVSEAEARRYYEERLELTLQYSLFHEDVSASDATSSKAVLVYEAGWSQEADYALYDAVTGELRSFAYAPMAEEDAGDAAAPVDIQGHVNEEALRLLLRHGVIAPEDGRLRPDEPLTRQDWAIWTAKAKYPDLSYSGYYDAEGMAYDDVPFDGELADALQVQEQSGWLVRPASGKFEPARVLTREELAPWIARMLNYDRLAALLTDDAQLKTLTDFASIADPGAAAITMKLGLLPATTRRWKPDAEVTRGEAAAALAKMAELQGTLDQPIGLE